MTTSPTDTPKRLVEKLREIIADGDRRGASAQIPTSVRLRPLLEQAADTIERLSTPPSQGKVEISEDGICWTCKCGWRSTFLDLKCPGCGNGQPAIYAAITQALTESDGQGTDGAEAMREAAAKAIEEAVRNSSKGSFDALGNDVGWATGSNNFQFDESYHKGHQPVPINFNSLARIIDKNCLRMAEVVRALPLPVSADGRDAVIEECAQRLYKLRDEYEGTSDNWSAFNFAAQKIAALKSKQWTR